MKYLITTLVADSPGDIEINIDEFSNIKTARVNLLQLLYIEEKLDLVLENFQEYESELLNLASQNMIFFENEYCNLSKARTAISKRIINLLCTCRMYLDQVVHHANNIYGKDSDKSTLIRQLTKLQYETNQGYRAMEALRNHVQHRGLPIHGLIKKGEWIEIDNPTTSRIVHTIIPIIDKTELVEDEKFKKSILSELDTINGKFGIDIRPLIRNYIEGIGVIHEKIREIILPDVQKWETTVQNAIEIYDIKFGPDFYSATKELVFENDKGQLLETLNLSNTFIDNRRILENKNRGFKYLNKRFASNEIRN